MDSARLSQPNTHVGIRLGSFRLDRSSTRPDTHVGSAEPGRLDPSACLDRFWMGRFCPACVGCFWLGRDCSGRFELGSTGPSAPLGLQMGRCLGNNRVGSRSRIKQTLVTTALARRN